MALLTFISLNKYFMRIHAVTSVGCLLANTFIAAMSSTNLPEGNPLQMTKLHRAVSEAVRGLNCYMKEIEEAVAQGAEVNAVDRYGNTPLHYAAKGNHDRIVAFLISKGAHVNAANNHDETPLHRAAQMLYEYDFTEHRVTMVKILLKNGSNASATTAGGSTPLHRAAFSKKTSSDLESCHLYSIVQLLLKHGAQADCTDFEGRTPLHYAAFNNHAAIVTLLLENGANPNAVLSETGWTPLHCAAKGKSSENALEALLRKRADVDALDKSGQTPLHWAVQKQNIAAIKLLVEHGASVNIGAVRKNSGCWEWFWAKTPLDIARSMRNEEIEEFLKLHGASQLTRDLLISLYNKGMCCRKQKP